MEDGTHGRVFYYDKIHDRNWYWKAPVHEMLVSDVYSNDYINSHALDLFDDIFLHHYPDSTKSRGDYLPLLILRAEEDPNDCYGLLFLAHEYHYRGEYQKSIDLLNRILDNFRYKYTQLEIASMYLFLGENYNYLGVHQKALYYYNIAIETDSCYREPCLCAAELCNSIGWYEFAKFYVSMGLSKSRRQFSWVEKDHSYTDLPYDILAVSYYYLGDYGKYAEMIDIAITLNPNNERLLENRNFVYEKLQNL